MKASIHPSYYPQAKVSCVCGNKFTVGSTRESLEIEICSRCHPFYSGQKKVIDAAGRVERYRRMAARAVNKATVVNRQAQKAVASKENKKMRRAATE